MYIGIDLEEVWINEVKNGRIRNVFENKSDPQAPHSQTTYTEIGIKINGDSKPRYYASVLDDNKQKIKDLEGKIEERLIEGTEFIIQYNPFRGYRPGCPNRTPDFEGILEEPGQGAFECRFGCLDKNKEGSLLVRVPAETVHLPNSSYNIYYNMAPVEEEGHYLFVPIDKSNHKFLPHITQSLTENLVNDAIWNSNHSKDSILFFNSIHAGATVNHYHLQCTYYNKSFQNNGCTKYRERAITTADTTKKAGFVLLKDYPARGFVFDNDSEDTRIWKTINALQIETKPFNWVLIGNKNYILPRKRSFEKVKEFPDILASLELSGKIITTRRETYDGATKDILFSAFNKTSLDPENLKRLMCKVGNS